MPVATEHGHRSVQSQSDFVVLLYVFETKSFSVVLAVLDLSM